MAQSASDEKSNTSPALEGGTYEILRNRLRAQAVDLKSRLEQLNAARKEVFGAIPLALLTTDRITTSNNCIPRDMVSLGKSRFLFGYNVYIGLRSETQVADVFAAYEYREGAFHSISLESVIGNRDFEEDFRTLYKYYKGARFTKFSMIGPHLFMVFTTASNATDFKTFKWLLKEPDLLYEGNRSDHEFTFPPQHEFEWNRSHRDWHRKGVHPHVSIEDRLFVETVGGDLTIKLEDNTDTGEGIYSEPVEHRDQTLDDAEIFYATVGHLILLKIRPYQERDYRYFVYNEKMREVRRIDAIHDSCVLLPDGQGIIFSSGYYLQLGEFKQFPSSFSSMLFERRILAPNGEDSLYIFHNLESGVYVLMSYNLIEQRVETPIVCNGFSLFENGELAYFKCEEEPQKHHVIQIWKTPYLDANQAVPERKESFLFKIGNPSIVRCLSECHGLLSLLSKEEGYADLYVDLVKESGAIADSYFWLNRSEAFSIEEPLLQIKQAAAGAIEEFEKVKRIRRHTQETVEQVTRKLREMLEATRHMEVREIQQYVEKLAGLRTLRGKVISLRDLRYADQAAIDQYESELAARTEELSKACVEFLIEPDALKPYAIKVQGHESAVGKLEKVVNAKQLEQEIAGTAGELEMLIDVVSNLKIDDSALTTRIIESISATYAPLNQVKAALKRRRQELGRLEGEAQFNAQLRLLDQSVTNYLELCDTASRCDEYLTKAMVQVEELEGRFAEFNDFLLQLAEKREELYAAFENRRLVLVEARNKRASALMTAADRILKGIKHRVEKLASPPEINGYFASDLMVDRVRNIVDELLQLDDSVKAGDIQSRLKTVREEALRQLKDRQELFVDGKNIIQFGKHKFAVNVQNLELTTVLREGQLLYHLTGTNFFEPIADSEISQTRDVWEQEVISENREVYRGEYLAYQIFRALEGKQAQHTVEDVVRMAPAERLHFVQQFMAPRYAEAYTKGVHDQDAARILEALLSIHQAIGLLRYQSCARACAAVFWHRHQQRDRVLAAKLDGLRTRNELFLNPDLQERFTEELRVLIRAFLSETRLWPEDLAREAAEYLLWQTTSHPRFIVSRQAVELCTGFEGYLRAKNYWVRFAEARKQVHGDARSLLELLREWIRGYLESHGDTGAELQGFLDEAAAMLFREEGQEHGRRPAIDRRDIAEAPVSVDLADLAGTHPVINDGRYQFQYHAWLRKLERYQSEVVPVFEQYHKRKAALLEEKRQQLRLEEFRPHVLTSFVRNRLIDSVYLPLIGDNLAKQIGTAGENTRTDRMGLLLLISPPGYGKTTLMEYIAERLGIVFMKINGPAIGSQVTSLDPAEAKNASAREEINKLNLALEMGDNVMLYLDDIQHCNPELLQKFISLCDGQRRIEGVYGGRARTYDLRGKKVAVVMAGNPYTESGEKFKIPDMLANRADTYNLGDIAEGADEAFKASYVENCLTSNRVLSVLAGRSQKDVFSIMKLAETGTREGITFEGAYSIDELNEMAAVMKKLLRIRDVILRVNQEYIRSAAQSDEYRTEPPFRLQGSYRNMNRLAERVVAVMNDSEVESLIHDHYYNEAQTLTTGAEANLLKFKELIGVLTESERQRWEEIKRTFKRNLLFRGANEQDPIGRVLAQLTSFSEGLESIRSAIAEAISMTSANRQPRQGEGIGPVIDQLEQMSKCLLGIQSALAGSVDPARGNAQAGDVELPSVGGPSVQILAAALDSMQQVLRDAVELQKRQPTFRLIDPSKQADYQITSVSNETLQRIWELVEEERKRLQ